MVITGDIHGDVKLKHLSDYADSLHSSGNSPQYLTIAGDFGGLWRPGDRSVIDACGHFPFTTLFVDGNHENFDLLNSYPVTTWKGGKVHQITEKVIHLMRGQVFELEGKTIFTFGGAVSTDREKRIPGLNWWPQELASEEELAEAERNLCAHGNRVDYIITHCGHMDAVQELHRKLNRSKLRICTQSYLLSRLLRDASFSAWFCGHYHLDASFGKYEFLYNRFLNPEVEYGQQNFTGRIA